MDAPRVDLVRALIAGPEVRADAPADGRLGVLAGRYAVVDQWTLIRSWSEGEFLERIARGAAAKTHADHLEADQPRVKVLFNHGHDPSIGDKVLGPIRELGEDDEGMSYAVDLLDTSYNRDLLPGLVEGLYGASFRFSVIVDVWNDEPGVSEHNLRGLPERTIREFRLHEFGPVTFPAYLGASAGMRSMTDAWLAKADPVRFASLAAERGVDLSHLGRQVEAAEPVDDEPREHSTPHPHINLALARSRARLILQGV